MDRPKNNFWSFCTRILKFSASGTRHPPAEYADEQAAYLELLNADQREENSKKLAAVHALKSGRSHSRLLARLKESEQALFAVHSLLVKDIEEEQNITPAEEWLLDNFYVIEEQIRTARRHLPENYNQELPHLANTASAGLPRVYGISLAAISYGDGRVDPETLRDMITAYQSVTILNLGELWAIPIMLRLTLIDKIQKIATITAANRMERIKASTWADQMIKDALENPKNLILTIADMARATPTLTNTFVAELVRRLRGLGSPLALPLTWIEQRLSENETTTEQVVRLENQLQAANQISISNCIGSLRTLDATNWRGFVEATSYVEKTLEQDPASAYALMDFTTRDRYRHVVEKLAKASAFSENEIAQKAVELALYATHTAMQNTFPGDTTTTSLNGNEPSVHVGYYLIDKGIQELARVTGTSVPLHTTFGWLCRKFPFPLYCGSILLLTGVFTAFFTTLAHEYGVSLWPLFGVGVLAVLAGSHLAFALVNGLATMLVTPQALPRLDFSHGIPPELRTLVAIPAMLTNNADIEQLADDLEVRFLANRDKHLHFALVTDFGDASDESKPEDTALLQLAQEKIEALNRKYEATSGDIFFLFHRARLWNDQEQIWMGYERKRGKLAALNKLLCYGTQDAFSSVIGNVPILAGVKYVITLDTDTQLSRDSARQFVGAMAHPLNRPRYDATLQRVVAGYGILQPRVAASLMGSSRSRYARLCSQDSGIDPYTRTTSDVYQDVFGEGSFTGKGIYDVAAFEKALEGRFPENAILSHDLLEGCYARSGLLSDVHLFEEAPASYGVDVARRHRWIRGDWQIAHWILPTIPGADGLSRPNPLSFLSRWKLLDNLRRSLTPAALLCLLLFGWAILSSPVLWSVALLGLILLPPLLYSTINMLQKSKDMTLGQHIVASARQISDLCNPAILSLACLPYEAWFSLDAVVRTLWRMNVSRRRMLEWTTFANTKCHEVISIKDVVHNMWVGPAVAATGVVLLCVNKSTLITWVTMCPLLGLWLTSPLIIWWYNRPTSLQQKQLTLEQQFFLRKLARKTWNFFATFVGPEDNWLPPDNYQEQPVAKVAHRTSPTNMGLSLLANLSAYDFGFITAGNFLERTEKSFLSMSKLERYKGHFYNWYDTQSLAPLPPLYVSSVDSGNLAGHLLTLRSGLAEIPGQAVVEPQLFTSLSDTFAIALGNLSADFKTLHNNEYEQCTQLQLHLGELAHAPPKTLEDVFTALNLVDARTKNIFVLLGDMGQESQVQFHWWLQDFKRQYASIRDEITLLCPWIGLPTTHRYLSLFPQQLNAIPTLRDLESLQTRMQPPATQKNALGTQKEETFDYKVLKELLLVAGKHAKSRLNRITALQETCGLFSQMDYNFLFDEDRQLLTIGYNVSEHRADAGHYDLLASEARLTSFVAIAQGALPQESWFALGRLLTSIEGKPILLSWSGSMFEYLMPLLVMPSFEHTLLDETYKAAVRRQIAYGLLRNVPWGVSECGYNAFDAAFTYQYRAFGVPGLGLKRGLAADLVIAPYASALALQVAPTEACLNLERLSVEGFESRYGLYEAIDYTPSRVPPGQPFGAVKSFMAHHQGMSLLALAHLLLDAPMQKRFAAEPLFQATMLLLQERVPKVTASYAHTNSQSELKRVSEYQETPLRILETPNTPHPEVQLLSNGSYHVMLTNSGSGYSRWKNLAITRWNEDSTRDNWGAFCYIKDMTSGTFWSTTYQPLGKASGNFQAIFSEGRAEFNCCDCDYDTHTEVVVASEDDIELRRVRITNRSQERRTIEVTSFAEIVLAPPIADQLHPAFSKLFVQTYIVPEQEAILCTRRPRSENEVSPWMLHSMAVHDAAVETISYETDRLMFIGRGRSAANPQAVVSEEKKLSTLSGREGSVLDPIVAVRSRIVLDAEQAVTIDLISGIGGDRETAMSLVSKYRDRHIADRTFDMTWTHGQVLLHQLNASEADAQLYSRLASSIIYANASLRAAEHILINNQRGQSGLWGYAISGDLPIVLVKIESPENIELVRQLLQAHEYWRNKGLAVELVIWNEDKAGYRQLLHDQIMGLIAAGSGANLIDRPGGIFVRAADRIADEDRILIQTVARVILSDANGSLSEQMQNWLVPKSRIPRLMTAPRDAIVLPVTAPQPRPDLTFFNGLGGFTPDGREYVITTAAGQYGQVTPAPWVNVLANPNFGTIISESGPAYTWGENAHEFRLTPWGNDPVNDLRGEAFYLRDEERGHFWSPTPAPCRGEMPYVTRHGFGYTVFEHTEHGIYSELQVYVDWDASIKFSSLKVRNICGRPRRLSATGYVEWVLGDLRSKSGMHIITEIDQDSGAILARNPYNTEFPDRTAFFVVDDVVRNISADRTEFVGRNGRLDTPAAMLHTKLSGKTGAALDPCGAIQVAFTLDAGKEREIVFKLGLGRDKDDAQNLIRRFAGNNSSKNALENVWRNWGHILGAVQVETPDQAFNMLANGWLIYQTLACRFWGRSATYQSGGAFGFRDQLQDVMALVHTKPDLVRSHILLCAAHQFPEGDVLHWWHPPLDRGVRTRCSDDYLWLPLATCRYVAATGDTGILDEQVHFIQGRPLKAEEESYYDLPRLFEKTASLYDHCVKAIDYGLVFGIHGLPLMGSGDWNDGMELVGAQGKGESVWLAFFLHNVLNTFSKIAETHHDMLFARRCRTEAEKLQSNIAAHAWDGEWYLRAFFDDGSPLGSATNPECRIDSIAQSWSVLSGAGEPERSRKAMDALDKYLVDREHRLVQLFDPPFDSSSLNPGYIKGYASGVRENGGQYTHAAIWATMAFAQLGDAKRAWELFALINPINHARSPEETALYMTEPYVMAADVYAAPLHAGKGGWTWYTGSAAWMYRLMTESLLGLTREQNQLHFKPCLPAHWDNFTIHYRYYETTYHIVVTQNPNATGGVIRVSVDGILQNPSVINLTNDVKDHFVDVTME